jgi:G protein-coupled receptor 157
MVRILIFFLALADLGTGISYLVSSLSYLIIYNTNNGTVDYGDNSNDSNSTPLSRYCTAQSFFTTFFPVSSFFWTAFLAIYFVVLLVLRKPNWSKKLLVLFNIVGWGVPLVICSVAAGIGLLGSNGSRTTGGWCFVKMPKNNWSNDTGTQYQIFLLSEALIGKGWELLSFFIVIICYGAIFIVNRKIYKCCMKKNSVTTSSHDDTNTTDTKYVRVSSAAVSNSLSQQYIVNQAVAKINKKLLAIPLVFILFRSFSTYRYFLSMSQVCHNNESHSCISTVSEECFYFGGNYIPFLYFQAFCDPLQGFGNAVIFIFCSRGIMKRFIAIARNLFTFCKRKLCFKRNYSHLEDNILYISSNKLKEKEKEKESLQQKNYSSPVDYGSLNCSTSSADIN